MNKGLMFQNSMRVINDRIFISLTGFTVAFLQSFTVKLTIICIVYVSYLLSVNSDLFRFGGYYDPDMFLTDL